MPMVMVETLKEFCDRHGGNRLQVGSRFVFPDGAAVSMDSSMFWEPPIDAIQALKARRVYVAEALRRAEQDFYDMRANFISEAELATRYRNLPGPPPDSPARLETAKNAALQWRDQLAEIDAKLNGTEEVKRHQVREAAEQARVDDLRRLRGEISAMNL